MQKCEVGSRVKEEAGKGTYVARCHKDEPNYAISLFTSKLVYKNERCNL